MLSHWWNWISNNAVHKQKLFLFSDVRCVHIDVMIFLLVDQKHILYHEILVLSKRPNWPKIGKLNKFMELLSDFLWTMVEENVYVAVKASLHASETSVFGLDKDELSALSKRFAISPEVINGYSLKSIDLFCFISVYCF